jgi:hypothetical protein
MNTILLRAFFSAAIFMTIIGSHQPIKKGNSVVRFQDMLENYCLGLKKLQPSVWWWMLRFIADT